MHKSGFVNIIGNANVGKSTLINALINDKLSIITPKAQTTRQRILGILNSDNTQIIFSDTPGIPKKPKYKLHHNMLTSINTAINDADILLLVIEPNTELYDAQIMNNIQHSTLPLFILINKIDLFSNEEINYCFNLWEKRFPKAKIRPISALKKFYIDELIKEIELLLPKSPPYYDKKTFTDKSEKFFVEEIIRKHIMLKYQKEIPYHALVVTNSFKNKETIIEINCTIYVSRETQKKIMIGHQGQSLKRVNTEARKEMESFFSKKVFLQTHIKTKADWRNNSQLLKNLNI